MIKRKPALAETISSVLNTVPQSYDPEDDAVDNTHAQTVEDFEGEEGDNEEELLSAFRKKNVDLLSDIDTRYSGKKASRSNMYEASEEESADDLDGEDSAEESAEDESNSNDLSDKENSENDEEESDNEDAEDNMESDYADEELNDDNSVEEDDETFKQIQEPNTSLMNKKGICVRNQLAIWEHLLEMRIQLQKCLLTSNKMPQTDLFNEIKSSAGEEFTNSVSQTKNNLTNLLDKMQTLQTLLSGKNSVPKEEDSDEEIKSDTDVSENEEEMQKEGPSPAKIRKIADYEKVLSNQHKNYITHRDTIIKKWYDKTRLAVNKNNSVQHSVLDQIKYHLSDREKLIKRTQLKRSNYNILGNEEPQVEPTETEESKNEYNREIFDDDDFYHQLLRELIEMKSSDITDPIQLGRQWIQLQSMRSKMKRKIDTRATKGRKIRYVVHNKLVNFMAPCDENSWTEEAKTELYNTLFGKKR